MGKVLIKTDYRHAFGRLRSSAGKAVAHHCSGIVRSIMVRRYHPLRLDSKMDKVFLDAFASLVSDDYGWPRRLEYSLYHMGLSDAR